MGIFINIKMPFYTKKSASLLYSKLTLFTVTGLENSMGKSASAAPGGRDYANPAFGGEDYSADAPGAPMPPRALLGQDYAVQGPNGPPLSQDQVAQTAGQDYAALSLAKGE